MPFSSPSGKHCIAALLLLGWSVTLGEPQAMSSPPMEPDAVPAERPFPPRLPQVSTIAAVLQHVVARMQRDGVTAANVATRQPAMYSTPLVRVDTLGRLHTVILLQRFDTQVRAALAAQQVQIERVEMSALLVQAWVPFDRLTSVATLPFVRYLRPPRYARKR
ncbi:MAG: hypothetical protein AB7N91_17415 [Candidatus Tectimicrobiota bacterium]